MENIDSLVKLAAVYEDYLKGHGIKLPHNLDERVATYTKRISTYVNDDINRSLKIATFN